MDADKKPEEATGAAPPSAEQSAPEDALNKTNEELAAQAKEENTVPADAAAPVKKINPIKKFFRRFNVYLLLFVLLLVVSGVVSVVSYLNSKKLPPQPTIATQSLTQDQLKQLANSDATVGDSGQTLTVQGNAIFSGQVLVRSNLNVAGTIQLGSELSVPQLTVSGATNLAATQVNTLQVAQGTTLQGVVTVQNDLNVGGASSFSGPMTASQITVTRLILSGNAQLSIPNHIAFTGSTPSRTLNGSVLGGGGSASVDGSDTAGTINVNSGNSPSTGCFITVNFNKAFTTSPHVVITPIGTAAGSTNWYVNRSTTSFSVCVNTPPPANQVFGFDYFVTG